MQINSTSQYLKTLDEIAEIIEKRDMSIDDVRSLNLKKLAVRNYEMQEVQKYPAVDALIEEFKKVKYNLN